MRCLGQLSRRAMDWYRWAPLSRVLQRALLWCLVLFGAAQVLLWRVRVLPLPVSATPAHPPGL